MILVLLAYCVAWGVHGEKICESTVQSLMKQPTQFSATPSAPKAATVTNIRCAAAGSCSFPTVQNSCQELLQKGNRKRRPKCIILADYRIFRTVTPTPLAQVGIDARAPFFSRRIRWTPPSFPWHNRVSAWLSLRVRASNYYWCPSIDSFL